MKKNIIGIISLFFSLIFADQLIKNTIRLQDGFYICNKGISFGLDINNTIFWILWLFIIGSIFYYIFKNQDHRCPLIMVLAGAFSNVIDRIYLGCVIDFIDIRIFNYPLFNLADTFIVIGAILIIVQSLGLKVKK
jgi:signal peptidase II